MVISSGVSAWRFLETKRALSAFCLLFFVAAFVLWDRADEPRYAGLTISQWLERLETKPTDPAAEQALLVFGEKAFPVVRSHLRRHDSSLKRAVMNWDAQIPIVNFRGCLDWRYRIRGILAMLRLGSRAAPLLPDLLYGYRIDRGETPFSLFEDVLLSTGSNGIPALAEAIRSGQFSYVQEQNLLEAWNRLLACGVENKSEPGVEVLITQVSRPDALPGPRSINVCAAEVLGSTGSIAEKAVDSLLRRAIAPDWNLRAASLTALGKIKKHPNRVVPVLARGLSDPQDEVRVAAVKALQRFGGSAQAAFTALNAAVADPVPEVALSALNTLRKLQTDELRADVVVASLQSSNRMVRISAARLLGARRQVNSKLVPALVNALGDEEQSVRVAAAESLGRSGPETQPAIDALMRALPLNSEAVQISIVEALGKIGPAARPAVSAIRLAWSNNQSALTRCAREALERIEGNDVEGR